MCAFSCTRSEIRVSSRLNGKPLAGRHTDKPRIETTEAGNILFARYSSQLAARNSLHMKRGFNTVAREGSQFKSTPLESIEMHC